MKTAARRLGVATLLTSVAVLTGIGAATLIDWCVKASKAINQHAEALR